MLDQQSTITLTSATTGQPALSEMIESAREKTRIAARIAESFNSLSEVSFSDLELIARNCYAANRILETVRLALADAEKLCLEAGESKDACAASP